jgi:DNA replication and repair protein RecF
MVIETVEIKNFRNYPEIKVELSEGINILRGENAQGKTNFLEAVYLCGMAKSHRGNKENEMIFFEKEEAHIKILGKKKKHPLE